jgi:hypothetical protein
MGLGLSHVADDFRVSRYHDLAMQQQIDNRPGRYFVVGLTLLGV